MKRFVILLFLCFPHNNNGYKIIWDKSADFNFHDLDARTEEVRLSNEFFIFPGTKWCGAGNIADHDTDFGPQRDTDKCCRNHDYCADIIEGFQTKYNLTNPSFYTRVHCDCDEEFYKCLKSVNTLTSNKVGQIYFTILGTKCFKEDFPIAGCDKYTYFLHKKCSEYQLDESQEKLYQWFDLANF